MTKMLLALAASLVGISAVHAAGGCGPFCNARGGTHGAGGKAAFQAAPWYLYWPYNAHFMTPAPLTGAYYAPPSTGAMLTSPYFPAQQPAQMAQPNAMPGAPVIVR
jgi:hypothetical protein